MINLHQIAVVVGIALVGGVVILSRGPRGRGRGDGADGGVSGFDADDGGGGVGGGGDSGGD